MGEIEAVAVGLEAERFDFGDALNALLVQVVFERQSLLLNVSAAEIQEMPEGRGQLRPCHKYTG